MGNAILKIGEQTKGKSGISNSRHRDEKRGSKCSSVNTNADKRITLQPVANAETKTLKLTNKRNGSEDRSKKKNNTAKSTRAKPNISRASGFPSSLRSSVSVERSKKVSPAEKFSKKSNSLADDGVMNQPSKESNRTKNTESRSVNSTNNIIQHTADIMAMVDEWKKEEERLQRDYDNTQQRIRVSLRQEHQAKAEAQTWRVQLEKLAISHRKQLFHQASLLRNRLQSAERHLVSTEQKVKGLATANSKLKGMINKANKEARCAQLHSEKKREEAKRELKEKLKSVEVELQNLTEKLVSSRMVEEKSFQTCRPISPVKYDNANGEQGAIRKVKPIHNMKWNISQHMRSPLPTEASFPVYKLSTVDLHPRYLQATFPRQFPQFSYNSYPITVVPQPQLSNDQSNWIQTSQDSTPQIKAMYHRRSKKGPRYGHIARQHTQSFPTSLLRCGRQPNCLDETSTSPHFPSRSLTSDDAAENIRTLPEPPSYQAVNNLIDSTQQKDHLITNMNSSYSRGQNPDEPNEDSTTCRNTATTRYDTSRGGFTPCDKCNGFSKQRLVVQQREVYNEFARARDRASLSNQNPEYQCSDHIENYVDKVTNTLASPISVWPFDERSMKSGNNEDTYNAEIPNICNCGYPVPAKRTIIPHSVSNSDTTSASTRPSQFNTSAKSNHGYGYFGDIERTASSLAVMKKRRIIHRRVGTVNRTR